MPSAPEGHLASSGQLTELLSMSHLREGGTKADGAAEGMLPFSRGLGEVVTAPAWLLCLGRSALDPGCRVRGSSRHGTGCAKRPSDQPSWGPCREAASQPDTRVSERSDDRRHCRSPTSRSPQLRPHTWQSRDQPPHWAPSALQLPELNKSRLLL